MMTLRQLLTRPEMIPAATAWYLADLGNRNEEEVRGYREALQLIHENAARLKMVEEIILELHRLAKGEIWDAGHYKEKNGDIIERYADGTSRIRFKTAPAAQTSG